MAATELLLAARERELGLPPGAPAYPSFPGAPSPDAPALDLYRRVVAQLPPPIRADTAEEMDAAIDREREAREGFTGADREMLARAARTDPVAAHFLLLLACRQRMALPIADLDALPAAIRAAPLVAYAAGACSASHADLLDAALEREPRFAEVRFHRGLQALGAGALVTADAELAAAIAAFPDAPAMHLARGQVHLQLQEFGAALESFDRVLGDAAVQRDALLGRVRALSHLGRAAEAAAGADRLIELGTWLLGDAYYWRAWNRRQLRHLDAAAADIESAKALMINAEVPKLAGYIAYDRGRYEKARSELEVARDRDASDCDVPFALGLVYARAARGPDAAASFASAADCAAAAQQAIEQRLLEIDAARLDARRKAAMQARAGRALGAARRQEGLAAINAARLYAEAGNLADARALAGRAAAWEDHRKDAERLLERLGP